MVKHSRPASLHVLLQFKLRITLVEGCKEVLQKEFPRIAVIDVFLKRSCMKLLMNGKCRMPRFPILHTLWIIADSLPPGRVLSLSPSLLVNQPPLRNVVLCNSDLETSWSSCSLKDIKSPGLLLDERFGSFIPFDKVLSVLKDCGQLEYLSLENRSGLPGAMRISELHTVELPHLRNFRAERLGFLPQLAVHSPHDIHRRVRIPRPSSTNAKPTLVFCSTLLFRIDVPRTSSFSRYVLVRSQHVPIQIPFEFRLLLHDRNGRSPPVRSR